jgi:hypothetical protein
MAQTGYTPISIYYSATSTNVPTAGNLVAGELAINTADGKLFYKDSAGVVQVIGTKGGVGSSSTTQVLYNSSGLVVGSANMTFSGTALTLANDASISGLTVGKGGGAVGTNTTVGANTLAANTTGARNTAIGGGAGASNTTGNGLTALGYNTLANNTTGSGNIAIGGSDVTVGGAMQANTTGSSNVAVGTAALGTNSTGSSNTAIGYSALVANTTASGNTAVGYQSLYTNSTGGTSTAIGYKAGYSNTADNNSFISAYAGYSVTSGTQNTMVGRTAGYSTTTGSFNTLVGDNAGYYISTGGKNTILGCYNGNQGGLDIRTASNYIVLSDGDGNPRVSITEFGVARFDTVTNTATAGGVVLLGPTETSQPRINIGHATGTASGAIYTNFLYAGTVIGSITQTGTTAVLYNTTSDYRLKTNATPIQNALATIQALNPVSFTWVDGRPDNGFIAHEIQAVIPNCVTGEKDAIDEDENPKYQQMDSSGVIPFLVKAIQELKAEFDTYKATHP